MGAILGGPKVDRAQLQPLPAPSRSDAEVADAALKERTRRRAMLGRSSTIATSDEGVSGPAPVRRALLGGFGQPVGA